MTKINKVTKLKQVWRKIKFEVLYLILIFAGLYLIPFLQLPIMVEVIFMVFYVVFMLCFYSIGMLNKKESSNNVPNQKH